MPFMSAKSSKIALASRRGVSLSLASRKIRAFVKKSQLAVKNLKRAKASQHSRRIRKEDPETENCFNWAGFARLVHQIMDQNKAGLRISRVAVEMLREEAQAYLCTEFMDADKICGHRGGKMLMVKDLALALKLKMPK